MDPRVRRFIEVNSDNVRSVREDVADYVGMTLEERGRRLSEVLDLAGAIIDAQPGRREEILTRADERSPESEALWRRLIARARAGRG